MRNKLATAITAALSLATAGTIFTTFPSREADAQSLGGLECKAIIRCKGTVESGRTGSDGRCYLIQIPDAGGTSLPVSSCVKCGDGYCPDCNMNGTTSANCGPAPAWDCGAQPCDFSNCDTSGPPDGNTGPTIEISNCN